MCTSVGVARGRPRSATRAIYKSTNKTNRYPFYTQSAVAPDLSGGTLDLYIRLTND